MVYRRGDALSAQGSFLRNLRSDGARPSPTSAAEHPCGVRVNPRYWKDVHMRGNVITSSLLTCLADIFLGISTAWVVNSGGIVAQPPNFIEFALVYLAFYCNTKRP